MTCSIINAESLGRRYGEIDAVDGVKLSVAAGDVCALLGPNGAGKTTLLRMLHGLIKPTTGSCEVLGDGELPRSASTMRSVGCLIDGLQPPGATRVEELITLNQAVSSGFDVARARELLAGSSLNSQTRWKAMSKGQQRWVLLVMLLCRRCEVLLLDEPADGLDPAARLQLYQLVRQEANRRGTTTLVATHIINDIEKIADEVCILYRGRLILHEPLEKLREQTYVVDLEERIEPPEQVQFLRTENGNHVSVWVRDQREKLIDSALHGEIRRRNMSLEEFYLAVIEHAARCLSIKSTAGDKR